MPLDRASSPRLKPYKRSCQGEADASTPSHIMEPLCLLSTVAWAAYSRQASVSGQRIRPIWTKQLAEHTDFNQDYIHTNPTPRMAFPSVLLFVSKAKRQRQKVRAPKLLCSIFICICTTIKEPSNVSWTIPILSSFPHRLAHHVSRCEVCCCSVSTWTSTFHSLSLHRMTSIPDMHRGLHLNRISCEFGSAMRYIYTILILIYIWNEILQIHERKNMMTKEISISTILFHIWWSLSPLQCYWVAIDAGKPTGGCMGLVWLVSGYCTGEGLVGIAQ